MLPGPHTVLQRKHAKRLLDAMANGAFGYLTASYIADGVIKNDDFEVSDEEVNEAFYFASDDTFSPSPEEILAALKALDAPKN